MSKVEFTPEKIQFILEKKGTQIDLEKAKIIHEFIKTIAEISVNQHLRDNKKKYSINN